MRDNNSSVFNLKFLLLMVKINSLLFYILPWYSLNWLRTHRWYTYVLAQRRLNLECLANWIYSVYLLELLSLWSYAWLWAYSLLLRACCLAVRRMLFLLAVSFNLVKELLLFKVRVNRIIAKYELLLRPAWDLVC